MLEVIIVVQEKDLHYYQKKLEESYCKLDFSSKFDFKNCINVITSAPSQYHTELQDAYCDLLLNSLISGYLRYSELKGFNIIKDPCFTEYQKTVKQYSQEEPIKQIYFAILDLITGDHKRLLERLNKYISARIQGLLEHDTILSCDDFIYCFVLPLKEGIPGMWSYLAELLNQKAVEEGIPEMCEALEKVYYCTKNDEIIDSLLQVLQVNDSIYLAKELLGYTYYNMQMWNNALSYFEQYEDVKDPESIFFLDTIYFWMAWCYGKKRDFQNEEIYYRKALNFFPQSEFALNNLGYSLYKQKKYDEAEKVFRECLQQKQDVRFAANNLVRTLLALGKIEQARQFIQDGGYKISKQLVSRLDHPHTSKKITVNAETPDVAPNIPTVNIGVKKNQFTSEKLLEDELIQRMEQGIPVFGLSLKVYQKRGMYGRQFILRNGRLDILAVDTNENLYVIELKKDSGYDDPYQQTKTYIDWVQKDIALPEQQVYGIICLNGPTAKLRKDIKQDPQIRLFEYSISYTEISG